MVAAVPLLLLHAGLLLGPSARPPLPATPVRMRSAALQLVTPAGPDELCEPAAGHWRGGWRRRLRKAASTALAACALASAAPRGAALAAPTKGAMEQTAGAELKRGAAEQTVVLPGKTVSLGKGPKKKSIRVSQGTAVKLSDSKHPTLHGMRAGPLTAVTQQKLKRLSSDRFLFSDALLAIDDVEKELQELQTEKSFDPNKLAAKTAAITIGTGALLFYGAKGMLGLEAWMREEERRDIREEIEKTGTFISSYAGDVETSIDARTGRNVTVVGGQLVNVTGSSRDARPPPPPATGGKDGILEVDAAPLPAWLPGFVKSAIEASSRDSNDAADGIQSSEQWVASSSGKIKQVKRPPKGGVREGGAGEGKSEDEDEDDDTGGLDTLDGLIG